MKDWLTIKEASIKADISNMTVRRWITKHKNDKNYIDYQKGIYYVNPELFSKDYRFIQNNTDFNKSKNTFNQNYTKAKTDEQAEDREKLALMTISKQANDMTQALFNRPFYRLPVFWVSITSILIIIILGSLGYVYRAELLGNHQRELKSLSSSYEKEVKTLNKNVNSLNNQLNNTKETYTILIDNLQKTHTKLNTTQEGTITQQEAEINRLRFELKSINKQTKTDTE